MTPAGAPVARRYCLSPTADGLLSNGRIDIALPPMFLLPRRLSRRDQRLARSPSVTFARTNARTSATTLKRAAAKRGFSR